MLCVNVPLQALRPACQPVIESDAPDHPSQLVPSEYGNKNGKLSAELLSAVESLQHSENDVDALLAATRVLGQHGAEGISYAHLLAVQLRHDRVEIRRVAAWSFAQLGAEASSQYAQDLALCLEDLDGGIRWQCAEALQRAGKEGARALAEKAVGADCNAQSLAEQALQKMGVIGAEALASFLSASDPRIRQRAASALGHMKRAAEPFVQDLATLLADNDATVRKAAAEALGRTCKIGSKASESCVDSLAKLLDDIDEGVRCSAIVALGRMGTLASQHTQKLCVMLLDQQSVYVKALEVQTLASIAAACLPGDAMLHLKEGTWTLPMNTQIAVLRLLKNKAESTKQIVAKSLGLMGVVGAIILTSQLGCKASDLRDVCIETLMGMKPEKPGNSHIGAAALASHLEGQDDELKIRVFGWLARLGQIAAPHAPTCYAFYTGNFDERTRRAALNAVCKMGTDTETTNVLLRDPTIVTCAIESTKESKDSIRLAKEMRSAVVHLLNTERQSAGRSWISRLPQLIRRF